MIVIKEAGGYAQLCLECSPDRLEPHDQLFVITWEWGGVLTGTHEGGMLRLCKQHVDELINLLLDALGEPR